MIHQTKSTRSLLTLGTVILSFTLTDLPNAQAFQVDNNQETISGSLKQFEGFDATSTRTIDHQPLTQVLKEAVFPVGRSRKIMQAQGKTETYINSRISKTTNSSPSRFEGNRLMLHAFTDDHQTFFQGYKQGLENLSNRRPLSDFNRNEQLAFWLNLYNVIVINKLIKEYPTSNFKRFRDPNSTKYFWDEKVASIEGVPVSLNDIEKILLDNYNSPYVVYGLFQGAIGGPTLRRDAFTGENVWKILRENAIEFINSNRGVRPKGNKVKVSEFFEWNKAFFFNDDATLINHIRLHADTSFFGDLNPIDQISYGYFDWKVADLVGGTVHAGTHINPASVLNAKISPAQGGAHAALNWLLNEVSKHSFLARNLPPTAVGLLSGIIEHNNEPRFVPIITTEECDPGETCEADSM